MPQLGQGTSVGLVLALLWANAAAAGARDRALKAIDAGDIRTAKKAIEALDAHLGSSQDPVLPRALTLRYQTEARMHHTRGKEADTLQALRQACVVHPTGQPHPEILGEGPLVDMFYAVCGEVKQRPVIALDVLALPDAPIRIDGLPPGGDPPLREGRHLIQVQCADGTWSSQWSELTKATDWSAGCPDGAVAPAEAPVSDDPMDMVPLFAGSPDDEDSEDSLDEGVDGTSTAGSEAEINEAPSAAESTESTESEANRQALEPAQTGEADAQPGAEPSPDTPPKGQTPSETEAD